MVARLRTCKTPALAVMVAAAYAMVAGSTPTSVSATLEGIEPGRAQLVPSVQAAFERESYRPGQHARLVIRHRSPALTMRVFESGPERVPTVTDREMNGYR